MKPIPLDIDDYTDMVQMFTGESERGAAVLAGSYIENYLAVFLEALMVDTSKDLRERIFGAHGSLNSFAQRIDFAQAFGHLSPNICHDLHQVRKIRNHFAHHPKEASFAESPVREYLRSMKLYPDWHAPADPVIPENDGKTFYLVAVGMLFIEINHATLMTSLDDLPGPAIS